RVAIVDQGKVIAEGSPRELIASLGGEHIIDFSVADSPGTPQVQSSDLSSLPGIQSVRCDNGLVSLAVAEPHVTLPALLVRLKELRRDLASLTTRHASLEDVFVTLTGRHLREDDASAS